MAIMESVYQIVQLIRHHSISPTLLQGGFNKQFEKIQISGTYQLSRLQTGACRYYTLHTLRRRPVAALKRGLSCALCILILHHGTGDKKKSYGCVVGIFIASFRMAPAIVILKPHSTLRCQLRAHILHDVRGTSKLHIGYLLLPKTRRDSVFGCRNERLVVYLKTFGYNKYSLHLSGVACTLNKLRGIPWNLIE